ncbi:MAG: hypothetical protein GF308_08435 [Candidatus Heimdallarchaeota archaeon]|nr:hypothetical protein [Candidatus Heimdallarchaeota archaeon]
MRSKVNINQFISMIPLFLFILSFTLPINRPIVLSTTSLQDGLNPTNQADSQEKELYSEKPSIKTKSFILSERGRNEIVPSSNEFIFPQETEEVSANNLSNENPSIVIGKNNSLYAFWEAIPTNGSKPDIFICKNNGTHWLEEALLVHNQTSSDQHPKVAIDSAGIIHLVWERALPGSDQQIWYTNSKNWSKIQPIGFPTFGGDTEIPDIMIDEYNDIHVTWQEQTSTDSRVFYSSNRTNWLVIDLQPSAFTSHPIIKWSDRDDTARICYLRGENTRRPEVTWIFSDNSTVSYAPENVPASNANAIVGYDVENGYDCITWLRDTKDLVMTTRNYNSPYNWWVDDIPDRANGNPPDCVYVYSLAGNTKFNCWCYFDLDRQERVFAISVYNDETWINFPTPLGESGYHYQVMSSVKDSDNNIHLIFERRPTNDTSQSTIMHLYVKVDDNIPKIRITNLYEDKVINGVFNVTVLATDASGISRVEFYETVNGTTYLRLTDYEAPYIWVWNTTDTLKDTRMIKVKAWDNNEETNELEFRIHIDNKPPEIENINISPEVVYDNSTVTLSCSFIEEHQTYRAILYYRFNDTTKWNKTYMTNSSLNYYRGKVNITTGGKIFEYKIESRDILGNVANSTIYQFEVIWIDSDNDGLGDNIEERYDCDPHNPDMDGDGLLDGEEIFIYGTDPLITDTDGDEYSDYREVELGSNPLNPNSVPPSWFIRTDIGPVVFFVIISSILLLYVSISYLLFQRRLIELF